MGSIRTVFKPVDEHGRVSLNALHRASVAGESKEPNKWLRGRQAQELIEELFQPTDLSAGPAPVRKVNGGSSPGTYAHPDLAISYAGWISPRFQLQVNRTFRRYQEGAREQRRPRPQAVGDRTKRAPTASTEKREQNRTGAGASRFRPYHRLFPAATAASLAELPEFASQ